MKNHFVLITSEKPDSWAVRLAATLETIGAVTVVPEAELLSQELAESCLLIVIDAAAVKSPDSLVSQLRSRTPESRIVIMTASPTWRRARAAFEAGALDYLPKSLEGAELLRTIRILINRSLPSWPRGGQNAAADRDRG